MKVHKLRHNETPTLATAWISDREFVADTERTTWWWGASTRTWHRLNLGEGVLPGGVFMVTMEDTQPLGAPDKPVAPDGWTSMFDETPRPGQWIWVNHYRYPVRFGCEISDSSTMWAPCNKPTY